ncbi:hypothetical protein ABZ863_25835 [Saccharomonospora sp. NPDC046836]|uniref:hypothetical protein n=1 Tax=Saccharomonospora sp. NPDC046836 TaxID=3156921 RepID=UPI0033E76E0F
MRFQSGDDYRSTRMVQAERELDGRIDFAFSRARILQEKAEEVEQKLAKDAQPPTNEEVARFKAYVLGHARTEEWQVVVERIGRGELTWRQIVESVAEGRLDRDVSAAMASLTRVPPTTMESLTQSGVLPDLDKAAAEDKDEKPAQDTRHERPALSDDEWFEDQSFLR